MRWASHPQVIQVDTNNHCGPEKCGVFCTYCYPQWKIVTGERSFMEMPIEYIRWIIRQVSQYGKDYIGFIDYFLNGDLLTELRGHEIYAFSKMLCPWLPIQSFTNGVLFENIHLALDPNLDSVCFTISGHTHELWAKIHRGNPKLFDDVIDSLETVLYKRHKNLKVEVHCVITEDNAPHLKEWWDFFGEFDDLIRVLSPLVASYDNLPSREAMGDLTLEDQEKLVIDVAGEAGRMWTRDLIPHKKPCVLWDNMSIDVEGFILQCCNWSDPRDWNYGTIQNLIEEGRNLRDVWIERLANRMRNPLCRSCNMKHPQWETRLKNMKMFVEA